MPCSRTQHGDTCEVQTKDLSIRSQTLYHYSTALLIIKQWIVIPYLEGSSLDVNEILESQGDNR